MEKQIAHHFALVSSLAYKDLDKNVEEEFGLLGYTNVKFFSKNGAQGYVLSNKEKIVVAFRGTQPDQVSDILADIKSFHNEGFHSGFLKEYRKLEVAVHVEVALQQKKDKKPLYITGHSLGAAMASICAFNMPDAIALYTYGCPRNASWFKAKELTVPHFRIVNNNDVVTKIPLVINYYGNVRKMSYWQRIKDSYRGRKQAWKKGQKFDSIYDHFIKKYIEALATVEGL